MALPEFDADREAVLARAARAGVSAILVVGQGAAENDTVLALCRGGGARGGHVASDGEPGVAGEEAAGTRGGEAPGAAGERVARPGGREGSVPLPVLLPCLGLHPDRWSDDGPEPGPEELERVRAQVRRERAAIVAIGEVGLDHYRVRDHGRRGAAVAALESLAALATELDLPLNVHSRSAGRVVLDVLSAAGVRRVLMHAFDGNVREAARAAEARGYLFSIPPSVVRSEQKQRLAAALPPEALALESDSPVLGPERGERNEPANLRRAVEAIACIRAVSEDALRELTTANARRLFGPRLAFPGAPRSV